MTFPDNDHHTGTKAFLSKSDKNSQAAQLIYGLVDGVSKAQRLENAARIIGMTTTTFRNIYYRIGGKFTIEQAETARAFYNKNRDNGEHHDDHA